MKQPIHSDQSGLQAMRERERMASAMICALCTGVWIVVFICCLIVRGCAPEPVAAYSICEQCGEVITDEDHGRCQESGVVSSLPFVVAVGQQEVSPCK